jgi:hypothetical protein
MVAPNPAATTLFLVFINSILVGRPKDLVSTLRPIEDQASFTLMKAFYRHLGSGEFTAE